MSRNLGRKVDPKLEIKTFSRKIENPTKKSIVKPLPDKPVLNSVLRLGEKVNSVREDLNRAKSGEHGADSFAVKLARDRVVNSPRTNREFRKVVARKVDFRPNEQIFSHLASLSITEDDQQSGGERRRKHFGRPVLDQDPGRDYSTSILNFFYLPKRKANKQKNEKYFEFDQFNCRLF